VLATFPTTTIIADVNKTHLLDYLSKIDAALTAPAALCIYGSAAFILLDEPDRTSLDVDVAAPYSDVNFADLSRAAIAAGLPINPAPDTPGEHIEWIQAARLCLAPPAAGRVVQLWQGARLKIVTVPPPDLIASKLIRYDELDQADIAYLLAQQAIAWTDIAAAVQRLPEPFKHDPVVRDNLANLKADFPQASEHTP
jgi:hypothetical protein